MKALEKFNETFEPTRPKQRKASKKALLPLLVDAMRFVIDDPGSLNISAKAAKEGPTGLSDVLSGKKQKN